MGEGIEIVLNVKISSPYRFRVIADDEEHHPNGPFIVEYYRGSILGGRWVEMPPVEGEAGERLLFAARDEGEDYVKMFEKGNPYLLDGLLAYRKTVYAST